MYNRIKYFFFILLFAGSHIAFAQAAKEHRVLVVLNGSASMSYNSQDNKTKFEKASDIITELIEEVYRRNENVAFGLRVYGHQFSATAGKCKDSRTEVFFSKDNLGQMALRLKDLRPKGRGSVQYAIAEAMKTELIDTASYKYTLIVITDSSDYCSDNICIPVNQLGKESMLFRRYVLDVSGKIQTANRYECFDRIFAVTNDYNTDTAINIIARNYQLPKPAQQKVKVVYETIPAKPVANPVVPVAKSKEIPIIQKPVTPNAIEGDTLRVKSVESAVKIRKESKIKSEVDEFGYLKLTNTSSIGRLLIYILQKGNYVETNEIYPVGMDEIRIKLKTGSYKMTFNVSGMAEGSRTFEVKTEELTDILFR